MDIIQQLIDSNPKILDFNIYIIGKTGALRVAEHIKNNTVISLDLYYNNILDDGACNIAEAIKINNSLLYVYMQGNYITCKGSNAIFKSLIYNKSLTKLDLGSNNMDFTSCKMLCEMLSINKTLKKLNLEHNNIGDLGAIEIANSLLVNNTLESLNISNANITNIGVKYIIKSLQKNTYITNLDVWCPKIKFNLIIILNALISENIRLTEISKKIYIIHMKWAAIKIQRWIKPIIWKPDGRLVENLWLETEKLLQ